MQHVVEADILEERMSLDLFCIPLAGAETPSRVTRQQLSGNYVRSVGKQ